MTWTRNEDNRRRRAEGRLAARRLIREHQLPMKVVAVDYVADANVFTVYFSAPQRVDFRALVRDLAARMRARVELQQIGPRDEARLQGGIGPCGRDLCCATFLKDFEPVSVRMAKDQDLPVNPMRIAGACGRLMCCLKYEHPLYQEFKKDAPRTGTQVETAEGPGTVVGHNVPSDSVVVRLAGDGSSCACSVASVCGSRKAYESTHLAARIGACNARPFPGTERAQLLRPSQVYPQGRGTSLKALSRLAPAAAAASRSRPSRYPSRPRPRPPGRPRHPPRTGRPVQAGPAVFVMTDNTAGNAVAAYHRAPDGTLTLAGTYYTARPRRHAQRLRGRPHRLGGGAYLRPGHGLLFAVNPGSNSVSVFKVRGDRLKLSQVIWSGGDFPVSVTVHGNHAYVLNALGGGTLSGYRISGGRVSPIPGSSRRLGLGTTAATRVHRHARAGDLQPGRQVAVRHHEGGQQRGRRVRRSP